MGIKLRASFCKQVGHQRNKEHLIIIFNYEFAIKKEVNLKFWSISKVNGEVNLRASNLKASRTLTTSTVLKNNK